jgi:hypothetical protein
MCLQVLPELVLRLFVQQLLLQVLVLPLVS